MQVELQNGERIDQLYSKGIQIIQSKDVFSFSLDAVLLADFVKVNGHKTRQIVDLCSGLELHKWQCCNGFNLYQRSADELRSQ